VTAWDARPIEIRNLFNPAFCAFIQATAIRAYEQEVRKGMPFSLSLLILPLALQEATRKVLVANDRAYFLKLVSDHPEFRLQLAERTRLMLGFTFDAHGLLHYHRSLSVSSDGRLTIPPRRLSSSYEPKSEEVGDCQQAARILGRQFGRIPGSATIYASLGLRP
jgi:hypothetical protein